MARQWSEIVAPFVERGVVVGEKVVFRPEVAVEVVAAARAVRTPVLGCDAFKIHGERDVEYFFEHGRSFTGDDGIIADSWSKAIAHLKPFLGSDFFFEVMIDD